MVTSVQSDATPTPRSSDKTTLPKAVMAGTVPTGQIQPDKTHVRFYPLQEGIHDEDLDQEAIWTDMSHDPNARDCGHQLHKSTW